jgi:DNA-binding response OmpR family regulator
MKNGNLKFEISDSSFILPPSSLLGEKMAPVVTTAAKAATKIPPRILVVDDEPTLIELVGDIVGKTIACKVLSARSVAEARLVLASTDVDLLVADVYLPDGDGTSLVSALRERQPHAGAIIITGRPTVDGAIHAIREGAIDFLPKPFTADNLMARVNKALQRQAIVAKQERRLEKLRDAVKRLNEARRMVSKKVDLLCNDLITAYGELSKQLDVVRTQEGFRNLLAQSRDLEQMLCHAMDWLLRQLGYSNVAVWLTGDDGEYQLGAYMKYTMPGEPPLTEAMRSGILRLLNRDGFLHLSADEARDKLSPVERPFLQGQTILGVTCTYLGESLAGVLLFRDGKTPFTDEDALALKTISPIFATSLASIVHDDEDEDEDAGSGGGGLMDDGDKPKDDKPKRKKKDNTSDADWWKRGEAPPF